jgi:hypothetical protein
MTKAYVQMVGRMAYIWGWPVVNSHNCRAAFAMAPFPGLNGGVIPMAPVGPNAILTDYVKPEQTFVACPNDRPGPSKGTGISKHQNTGHCCFCL